MSGQLPAVAPSVTAALVGALSPRLRKRLDAAVTKLSDLPRTTDGDTVRVSVDDHTDLLLHAPDGTVTSTEQIRCGCLLAPDCLHRAAVARAAPVGDDPPAAATVSPGSPARPAEDRATDRQRAASAALWVTAAAVLEGGIDGSGAVRQAQLLRAAHTARLAGLPRAAAAAVSVVTRLRAARSADPAHRLAELAAGLRDLLATVRRIPEATDTELAALRGTARQTYRRDGPLRLYGLFTEPLITAGGFAGVVTWTTDADGRLYTLADIAPGGPAGVADAAHRTVRLGDTALTHRDVSRTGIAVSGATVSPTGRLGSGAGVRAVRAPGAAWTQEPLTRLWSVPAAEQAARAAEPGSGGLLFLDVTLGGTVRETGGDCLLADCHGLTLRITVAHDHPALAYRENLRVLASAPGLRLRIIGRLDPAAHPRLKLLATTHPTDPSTTVDTGLDRLPPVGLPTTPPGPTTVTAPPGGEPPLHLLARRVEQAVSGGRQVLSLPGTISADARRLRRCGLVTAGDLLDGLGRAGAERARDPFGRLLGADTDRFADAWLAAAVYAQAVERHGWALGTPSAVANASPRPGRKP